MATGLEFGKVTLTTNGTTARTVTAQLRMTGDEGDDDAAEPMDGAEVVQPLGFISRPVITRTTEAAFFRVGNEIVVVALLDKGATPFGTLAEGDAMHYAPGNPASNFLAAHDGHAEVNSAPDHHVVVNQGELPVARRTDGVVCGRLSGAVSAGVVQFTFQPLDADGNPDGSPIGPSATIEITGVISGGIATFKA